jgi:hypothetical protein
MRKALLTTISAAVLVAAGAAPALAGGGGMGDVAAHIKEMNALCELQKRHEAAPYPDLCLPEYPPGSPADNSNRR